MHINCKVCDIECELMFHSDALPKHFQMKKSVKGIDCLGEIFNYQQCHPVTMLSKYEITATNVTAGRSVKYRIQKNGRTVFKLKNWIIFGIILCFAEFGKIGTSSNRTHLTCLEYQLIQMVCPSRKDATLKGALFIRLPGLAAL